MKKQEVILNSLLQQIVADPEVASALTSNYHHSSVFFDLNQVFRGYNQISETDISDKDMEALNALDDADLRERLAKLISKTDPALLQREAQKPHGGFEIADMEFPINLQGESFYLCLPIKSGKEIKNTVPERWAYQILRPFLNFDRCVVVFVSAKRCSQNLMNYIKRTRDRLGWTIEVIEAEELAKLLKVNSLL